MPTDWVAKVMDAVTNLEMINIGRVLEPDKALAIIDDVVTSKVCGGGALRRSMGPPRSGSGQRSDTSRGRLARAAVTRGRHALLGADHAAPGQPPWFRQSLPMYAIRRRGAATTGVATGFLRSICGSSSSSNINLVNSSITVFGRDAGAGFLTCITVSRGADICSAGTYTVSGYLAADDRFALISRCVFAVIAANLRILR